MPESGIPSFIQQPATKASEDELPDELLGEQAKEKSDYLLDESATEKGQVSGVGAGTPMEKSPFSDAEKAKGEDDFEVAVVTSREWEAQAAGKEIATKLLEKMKHKPKFILLFTTIHYEKHGGFQPILDEIYNHFPDDVPLVGGTVAGFMNREGAFTRGATAFAVYNSAMAVSIGIGLNTKRTPQMAAKNCAEKIDSELKQYKSSKKYFFTLISSAKVPNIFILPKNKVVEGVPGIETASALFDSIFSLLEIGPGRDESILEKFYSILDEYDGIGGASTDNLRMENNFQFYNNKKYSNSIVALGFAIPKKLEVKTEVGINQTGKKFSITNASKSRYIINQINFKPAVQEYLRIMGWNREVLDERLYRKVFYFPIVSENNGQLEPRMFGLVYGNSFIFPMSAPKKNEFEIYYSKGSDLLKSSHDVSMSKLGSTGLVVSCGTRLETLGNKIYKIKEEIFDVNFKKDYLVVYTAGEYSKYNGIGRCLYQSDNAILF